MLANGWKITNIWDERNLHWQAELSDEYGDNTYQAVKQASLGGMIKRNLFTEETFRPSLQIDISYYRLTNTAKELLVKAFASRAIQAPLLPEDIKAMELIKKFNRRQYALCCVQEILSLKMINNMGRNDGASEGEFWEKVKNSLERNERVS